MAEKRKDDSMKAAIQAVEEGQSVSIAARDHGVPKTSLHDRISGKVVHKVNPGPSRPYLSREEEKELGSYLKQSSKIACGKLDEMCVWTPVARRLCRRLCD